MGWRSSWREARASRTRQEALIHVLTPKVAWPGGVVSFTFDDFPQSAWSVGGAILADHGARGTFYAASDLIGGEGPHGRLATREDIEALHEAGHEIGCHTRSHLRCSEATDAALQAELRENAEALQPLVGGRAPTSFAYPFGAASPRARRIMRRRFVCARGIQPGLNRRFERGELRANAIYDRTFDADRLWALVDENHRVGGWLIFYTHDVEAQPSAHGCTARQLEAMVSYAAKRSEVLRVDAVAARLGRR